jgi:hypothetical protein
MAPVRKRRSHIPSERAALHLPDLFANLHEDGIPEWKCKNTLAQPLQSGINHATQRDGQTFTK